MAKAAVKVYPYVTLGDNGEFQGNIHVENYRSKEAAEAGGNISEYSNTIYVHLPMVEVEVDLPTDAVLKQQAAKLLQAHRTHLRAEHQKTLTKLQFLENQLLGLAHSDILDAEVK